MTELLNEFDRYVARYGMNNSMIELKYFHSYRVMKLCTEIADDLKLNQEDTYLAIVIGLLHDYGRFEQWSRYKTYNDINSIDHGDLACELLFNNNEIEKFNIDKKYYDVIYNAIKYHNKYTCPKNIDEKSKMFCEIIRDADKLDILYLTSIGDIKISEDDNDINEIVKYEFAKKQSLNKKYINNASERLLLRIALIFDLNYKYSYQYINNNNLIDKIYTKVNNKAKFKSYFDDINEYIETRGKEYVRKKI